MVFLKKHHFATLYIEKKVVQIVVAILMK